MGHDSQVRPKLKQHLSANSSILQQTHFEHFLISPCLSATEDDTLKQTVTLHFPSLDTLYRFRKEIDAYHFEVSIRALLLTCDCTKEQIERATTYYGAKVISSNPQAQ